MAGSETARHVSAAHASAVDWVTRVVREEGIECELELGEAVVAAVAAERGGVAGAAASTAGAGEGYGKWKKDKASRELREVGLGQHEAVWCSSTHLGALCRRSNCALGHLT